MGYLEFNEISFSDAVKSAYGDNILVLLLRMNVPSSCISIENPHGAHARFSHLHCNFVQHTPKQQNAATTQI